MIIIESVKTFLQSQRNILFLAVHSTDHRKEQGWKNKFRIKGMYIYDVLKEGRWVGSEKLLQNAIKICFWSSYSDIGLSSVQSLFFISSNMYSFEIKSFLLLGAAHLH